MKTARFGQAEVVLPDLDDELQPVPDLGRHESVADFVYGPAAVRDLSIADRGLARGRLHDIEAQRAEFTDADLESLSFERCALLSGRWQRCGLNRVVLRGCRLIGPTLMDHRWSSVLFEDCVIEYATIENVQAAGPVAFVNTKLSAVTFTRCDFRKGHASGCELRDVSFIGGTYKDFDLRGNDLSSVRGAANLRGAIVHHSQRPELAEALVAELELNYVDGPV